jgi:hypothetical protein
MQSTSIEFIDQQASFLIDKTCNQQHSQQFMQLPEAIYHFSSIYRIKPRTRFYLQGCVGERKEIDQT